MQAVGRWKRRARFLQGLQGMAEGWRRESWKARRMDLDIMAKSVGGYRRRWRTGEVGAHQVAHSKLSKGVGLRCSDGVFGGEKEEMLVEMPAPM